TKFLTVPFPYVSLTRKIKGVNTSFNYLVEKFVDKDGLFLLESSPGHDQFSYIGFDPFLEVKCFDDYVEIKNSLSKDTTFKEGDIFEIIRGLVKEYSKNSTGEDKYQNGLVGFLTYECVKFIEKIDCNNKRELNLPLAVFTVPRSLIIRDHHKMEYMLVQNVFKEEGLNTDLNELFYRKKRLLEQYTQLLKDGQKYITEEKDKLFVNTKLNYQESISKKEYIEKVSECKEYIIEGDIFQIQLSRRLKTKFNHSPIEFYFKLKEINPSPYMFFMKFEDKFLIGASPELLVKVENREMYLYPIAGTRKRYSTRKTEEEIIDELKSDEKERAEHIMLVDLARNEIGRVSKYGTVKVKELMGIEKYSHVIHMVSIVQGTLQHGKDAIDALKSSFPAGTVTGAPKIRAMEIISEMENVQREFYSGGMVFHDFTGNLKSSIIIRSVLIQDGYAYTQAAAGVVYDSIPENEFKETTNKMQACLQALAALEQEGVQ
ncbi:chorismate-binding protein, partial [Shouchella clausii]|uniref:anthranilate synthase component I family protein n=3 Tax=Shouchella clausii TaxID=79880 RepID=UPI002DBACBCD